MSNKQRLVLLFSVTVTILMVLFPPWRYTMSPSPGADFFLKPPYNEYLDANRVQSAIQKSGLSQPIGYTFIGTPPNILGSKIDLQRLLIQFCGLAIITGTLFFVVAPPTKREAERNI